MKNKKYLLISMAVIIVLGVLCGCTQKKTTDELMYETMIRMDGYEEGRDEGYKSGYDEGYDDGYYAGYDEGYDEGCYEGEKVFNEMIYLLMVDQKYEMVEEVHVWFDEYVEDALEMEFGERDINKVKQYIDEKSQTEVGICGYCNKTVYWGETGFIPREMECAHETCVLEYYVDPEN